MPPEKQDSHLLLPNIRFKQIQVLEDYGVMMAVSGKHDHVRQYKLASIKKLIRHILGDKGGGGMNGVNGGANGGGGSGSNAGSRGDVSKTTNGTGDYSNGEDEDVYKNLHSGSPESEETLLARWVNDYIKILATKDSHSFSIERTESSIHMGVLFRQDIILFEWAKEPYLRFMKVKAFWLPETPKFIQILTDGVSVRELYLAYASEANLVSVDDSKVKELDVSKEFLAKAGFNPRWTAWQQLPIPEGKKRDVMMNASTATGKITVNRKLAAVSGIKNNVGGLSISDRYFIASYGSSSKTVSLTGTPVEHPSSPLWREGVVWSDQPDSLLVSSNESFVLCVSKTSLEVSEWRHPEIKQKYVVDNGIRLLSRRKGWIYVGVGKKKKPSSVWCLREIRK